MKLLLAAALAACLVVPAFGEEKAPVCKFTYDAVAAGYAAQSNPVVEIDPADLSAIVAKVEEVEGKAYPNVTRGFVVNEGGRILLGLEADGCMLPPILIGIAKPERLSGREGDRIGA